MTSSLCTTGCLRNRHLRVTVFPDGTYLKEFSGYDDVLTDECISARGLEAADCSLLYLFVASCKCIRSWCLVEFVCF